MEVSSEQMDDFFAFMKSHFVSGVLPSCELLEYYNDQQAKKFPVLMKNDHKCIMMTPGDVDTLCEWILITRDDPNYVL